MSKSALYGVHVTCIFTTTNKLFPDLINYNKNHSIPLNKQEKRPSATNFIVT